MSRTEIIIGAGIVCLIIAGVAAGIQIVAIMMGVDSE